MLTKFWRRSAATLAALALVLGPMPASAMRVSPMVVEMESQAGAAVARIEVQNINKGGLAFETRIYRMTLDADGKISEVPADEDFLVFPPQGVLSPGARQVVRLQWAGAPDIAASQAYYVSVNQLPIKFAPTDAGSLAAQVQVVYNMRALVVVAPPGATPNVSSKAVRPVTYTPESPVGSTEVAQSVRGLEVTLTNSGRRHAMMSGYNWRFEGTDLEGKPMRVDVSTEELNRAVGTGYVPALGQRTFRIPVLGFSDQPVRLTFFQ
ncbi:molecular chaperone [Erythrobacter neustonensis]|nr:fimbria/pilus periplasmic chaperone [Erythrobacter neustonensis]